MAAASVILGPNGRPHNDGLANVLTGLLGRFDPRITTGYTMSARLTQPEIDELYENDPIAAKVIDDPSRDCTRKWFELRGSLGDGSDKDWTARTMDALDALQARTVLADFLGKNRKDGGALLLPNVDDGVADLSLPLDKRKARKIRSLDLLERWGFRVEFDTDRASPRFGKPLFYTCYGARRASTKIHYSRVIALHGLRISENRDAQNEAGWGASELQRPAEALKRYAELWGYCETTFKHFSQQILKMADLGKLLQAGQDAVIQQRMAILGQYSSTIGITPIDKDDELVEHTVTFSGVAQMLSASQDRVASATGMPVTKLFGHAPGGLSTDDASGRANWQDYVSDMQSRLLIPAVNQLLDLMFASSEGPTAGLAPKRYQVDPRPLEQETDEQVSQRRYRDAQTDAIYLQLEAVTIPVVQQRLRSDPTSPYELPEDEADLLGVLPPLVDDTELTPIVLPGPGEAPAVAVAPIDPPPALPREPTNAAQIAQALLVVQAVVKGELPRDSGIAFLETFYALPNHQAAALMGSAGAAVAAAPGTTPALEVDAEEAPPPETPFSADDLRNAKPIKWVQAKLGIGRTRVLRLVNQPNGLRAARVADLWRFDPTSVDAYWASAQHQAEAPNVDAKEGSVIVHTAVPSGLARLWPIDGRVAGGDDSRPHVTLLYLPKVEPEKRAELIRAIEQVVRGAMPFSVEMKEGSDSMVDGKTGQTIHIKAFRSPAMLRLHALHLELLGVAESLGIEASKFSDEAFTPHSTLAYRPAGEPVGVAEMPEGSWIVEDVDVTGIGPDRRIALTGR